MNDRENFIEKLNKEIKNFKESYNQMLPAQVYEEHYKIGFYEAYFNMLSCDFIEHQNIDNVLNWLAEKENPLKFLYNEWLSCDGEFSHDWNEMLDWVREVYREEMSIDVSLSDLQKKLVLNDELYEMSQKEPVKDVLNKDETFRYMLLDRMRSDCDYYLGNGNCHSKHLWGENEKDHINYMKLLWLSFPNDKKPEWLSYDQLINYEKKMLSANPSLNDKIIAAEARSLKNQSSFEGNKQELESEH